MGFLKRFFKNVFHEGMQPPQQHHGSSFERLSEEELETHLAVARYGNFSLTDAVRPAYDLKITPRQGYRHDVYRDDEGGQDVPVLMASATKEHLFELFMDLLEPLGGQVDVVLETSHQRQSQGHSDLYREAIDMPVLQSILWDFEELLVNDGCTGIAVLNPAAPQEVQFDEHKLLIVYGEPLGSFERTFREFRVNCDNHMRFITEAEHVHSSRDEYVDLFHQLKHRLGIDDGGW